jgi:hypothetical protein
VIDKGIASNLYFCTTCLLSAKNGDKPISLQKRIMGVSQSGGAFLVYKKLLYKKFD